MQARSRIVSIAARFAAKPDLIALRVLTKFDLNAPAFERVSASGDGHVAGQDLRWQVGRGASTVFCTVVRDVVMTQITVYSGC